MSFAAPFWLLGLLPWAAVALYLLWGRRKRQDVPFLELWQVPGQDRPVRRRAAPPPVALACALLAVLLAVLGAASPRLHLPAVGAGGPPVASIVVDGGFTMSARGRDRPRYYEALDATKGDLLGVIGFRPVWLSVVPSSADREAGAKQTDLSDALGELYQLPPSAADSRAALRAAVLRALAETAEPVIVLSDQPLGIDDDRLIQIPPPTPLRDAGIVSLAARERPAPQVMVRLRNHGLPAMSVTLRVTSDGRSVEKVVALPVAGEADAFVDLPALGQTVEAELVGLDDDEPADDRAWLVREASWPRVEVRAPLPPGVRRMIEQYTLARPPEPASPRVVVVGSVTDAPGAGPAVIVEGASTATATVPTQPSDSVRVQAHPVTAGIDWAKELADLSANTAPQPPRGWQRLVWSGERTWVAASDEPAREVWVGFPQAGAWARREAFVYFWANLLDWVGQGGESFAAGHVGPVEGQWAWAGPTPDARASGPDRWPGLYRRSDGRLQAFNAPAVPLDPVPSSSDWQARLRRHAANLRPGLDLSPLVLLGALACMVVSAATWKRRRALPSPPPADATRRQPQGVP